MASDPVSLPSGADRTFRALVVAGALVYLATALGNVGVVAIDDYADVMSRVLPAARSSVAAILRDAGFRSPVPNLIHLGLTSLAERAGLTHPLAQLRADQAVLGLSAYALLLAAGLAVFRGAAEAERSRHRVVWAGLLGFYLLAPFVFTRPMIESLAAPLVAAAAGLACRYQATGRRAPLVLSLVALTVAALMRPQAGVCAFALGLLVLVLRRWRDLGVLVLAGVACVALSGLVDLGLFGEFHATLRRYVAYNAQYSSTFGTTPWYSFILLFVALSIPPVFLLRWRGFPWAERYRPLLPVLLFFLVFVGAHSLIPHKEERFMIPALPLFLMLLVPLLGWLLERREHRWRVILFAVVNLAGLVLVSATPPQRTSVALAGLVDRTPAVTSVTVVGDFLLVPTAFMARPVTARRVPALDGAAFDCGSLVAVLALTAQGRALAQDARLREVGRFGPGPLEAAVVALNPAHNARRGPVAAYRPSGCGGS